MRILRCACWLLLIVNLGTSTLMGQSPASAPAATAPAASAQVPVDLSDVVARQFGDGFEVVSESPSAKIIGASMEVDKDNPATWTPLLTGDLDGDGVEDAVIIVRNKNPLIESQAFNYKVLDVVNGHYGWGDPHITMDFNTNDPLHNMQLLIIHGAGKEGWRAATPKAKFVLINVPFEHAELVRGILKKHQPIATIRVEESDTISSLVFWDGKKYKYIPGGGE